MDIRGEIKGGNKADIVINGKKIKTNNDGQFNLKFDLFKHGGGHSESIRLDIPLLSEIPYSHKLMESIDIGEPIVFMKRDPISKIFLDLAQKITAL